PRLQAGQVAMDLTAHRVFVNGEEVKLSYKEFELLATLMRNKGAVLTRQFLITQVWGYDFEGDMRTLDVHIRWLREKIERDPSQPAVLQTVRGVGYRVEG
ncbi:MAG: winged helix-turn-helix domain-containing protein, partial [Anaerolineae bacterium]